MIGIYGGTFDPIHYGHLRPALDVYQALPFSEIRFVPCGEPAHRGAPLTDAAHRLVMLRMALANQAVFKIDERELHRKGPSYMVDTLKELRAECGKQSLSLILGFDAFLGLESWHQWQDIFKLAHLVVTHRPGWHKSKIERRPALKQMVDHRQMAGESLSQYPAGGIAFIAVTQLDISSTLIRELIMAGKDVRYLLPDNVYELIKQEKLYNYYVRT
ncbi:Nicotinate-nucleotide adenylyltransferase [hydrothermal vent metagenome]|uniref:Nicotinate-nucleotide adenylyltransferase n=1 Tax=hydrothermal vent metagenome TaxID=652676 RepID=A0A3B1BXU9_9ZZZZ